MEKDTKVAWFPGHMKSALDDIEREKIKLADAILYVVDSRAPFSCMNPDIDKITHKKPMIYLFNKIDFADEKRIKEIKSQFEDEGKIVVLSNAKGKYYKFILKLLLKKSLKKRLKEMRKKELT